jgi:hypothetical protein
MAVGKGATLRASKRFRHLSEAEVQAALARVDPQFPAKVYAALDKASDEDWGRLFYFFRFCKDFGRASFGDRDIAHEVYKLMGFFTVHCCDSTGRVLRIPSMQDFDTGSPIEAVALRIAGREMAKEGAAPDA